MICGVCADRGIVLVNWADAEPDFAVCLCAAGLSLRVDRNTIGGRGRLQSVAVAPRWVVWCAREQVDPSRVLMLEDVLTPEELAERGVSVAPAGGNRETALLAAGKMRKGPRP